MNSSNALSSSDFDSNFALTFVLAGVSDLRQAWSVLINSPSLLPLFLKMIFCNSFLTDITPSAKQNY